ncbi:MAG: 3'-5' exonuclease [Tenuifilaceae bacterium]|nr:3'-5' exonuclease [Tenuifilaceae bacterium]
MQYLNELSEVQREAVTTYNGPALIIAGAGSGKTRVLTYRIAHLLKQGVPAWAIMALTFTNKAAREMKDRIASVVGDSTAKQLWMGTFHSIFMRILRAEADKLGYVNTFTIYDTADSKSLIASIIKELKLDTQLYKTNEVLGRISSAKNNLITAQAYANNTQLVSFDRQTRKPEISKIYAMYVQRCYKASAMDFDDLLMNTNILFRDFPDVLAKYQNKFRYLLVDEYQDTNYSQYLIVKKLAASHNNVCVVGDDAQSIYSFRGAKIENILNFRNDYPNYKLFKLEQNYRSTQTIVNAANSVIAKNKKQIQKASFSAKDVGDKVKIIKAYTDQEESFMVASAISEIIQRVHVDYKNFAILYRTNAQSRLFEESLRKRNIPYRVYGSLSFYQRKEIKDTLAYFRLTINPNDDEALKRIINFPARGIGNTTMERLEATANEKGQSLWITIGQLNEFSSDLKPAAISKVMQFYSLMKQMGTISYTAEAYEAAQTIIMNAGLMKEFKADGSIEGITRLQNIEELLNSIKEFSDTQKEEGVAEVITLADYLENVSLLTDADNDKPEDRNKVSIMTIHSAKGLEFDYVFLAGVEEELFPSKMSTGSLEELEEERRLFYVALTRAAKLATISHAQVRYKWGSLTSSIPSRFIAEIDPEFIEATDEGDQAGFKDSTFGYGQGSKHSMRSNPSTFSSEPNRSKGEVYGQRKLLPIESTRKTDSQSNYGTSSFLDPSNVRPGINVLHDRFGPGKVVSVEGEGQNCKAIVEFRAAGVKSLLLKFAKLKEVK